MPRIRKRPEYTLHRSTRQARVRINGTDHYLGEYGTAKSRDRYDELINEWFATATTAASTLLIEDLVLRFMAHAQTYYVKDSVPTSELHNVRNVLAGVVEMFGTHRAKDFGPKMLKAVREKMVAGGVVRTSINRNIGRIRRMYKWAVAEELLAVEAYQSLCTLPGLRAGRSAAKESIPVKPVPEAFIDAIEPFVSRQVWAMIQLQRFTGARSGEIVTMRGGDLNTKGRVWEFIPERHKGQHHNRGRVIFIGPRAQAIVREFLKPDLQAFLFSPADAKAEHYTKLRANRKTPMTPSQLARERTATPEKRPGDRYTVLSYGRAIANACKRADRQAHKDRPDVPVETIVVPHWHPHQLRHNAATELRREFGIESARTVLGHASTVTSEIYAEKDYVRAREIMATVG